MEYVAGKGCAVSDDKCKEEKPQCIETNGKCDVNEEGQMSCGCPDKKKYVAEKGCTETTCSNDDICKNGGKCEITDGKEVCVCFEGTAGDTCETVTDCEPGRKYEKCSGENGKCVFDIKKKVASCNCPSNKVLDPENGFCRECDCGKNAKNCSFEKGIKVCTCKTGFVSTDGQCVAICKKNEECKHGGTCDGEGDIKTCTCLTGTSGDKCENIDECSKELKDCKDDKGTCVFNTESLKAECECPPEKVFNEDLGYCEVCDCGDNAESCRFEKGQKICTCKKDFASKNGKCEECNCGANSTGCSYEGDKKICTCEDGYAQKNGTCEECKCGENTKPCRFEGDEMICDCEPNYAKKDGECTACDCGNNSTGCTFNGTEVLCECDAGYKNKNGKCAECNCGANSTECNYEGDKKICTCKRGHAQKGDTCEECKCGLNTKPCRFEGDEKKCDCREKYAEKDGICTACKCGNNSTGCTFNGDEVLCKCHKGYANKNGMCAVDFCYQRCDVNFGEDHEDVKCEGDIFQNNVSCICHDDYLKFDYALKKCRTTCSKAEDCENGAPCEEKDGHTFCICINGTSGDACETVTDCQTGGKYEKCSGEKGKCGFNQYKNESYCNCSSNKILDENQGYCRDMCNTSEDCTGDKICDNNICTCEPGKDGENCDIITGCNEDFSKKCKEAGAVCDFDRNATNYAACRCLDERLDYNETLNECVSKFCNDIGCKDSSKCEFDKESEHAYCRCPSGKYYDYNNQRCREPNKCLLKTCKENEVCENGNCRCNGEVKEDKCIKTFCKPQNPCFTNATCNDNDATCKCQDGRFYSGSECKEIRCILDPFGENCPCPPARFMKRNNETKKCEPSSGKKLCEKKCGLGYCIDNTCQCINGVSVKYNDTCILDKNVCASKTLTDDLSKCYCTEKYKEAKDGITCELITCNDEVAITDCKSKGATCQMAWTGTSTGYECRCPSGYVLDKEKGICTDPCIQPENMLVCSKRNQVCYNSYSTRNEATSTCDCQPPFRSKENNCTELAPFVYLIKDIPVLKERYEMQYGIDYVKLNSHLMQALSQMFDKTSFDSGYLHDYKVEGGVLKTSAWVRFNSNVTEELWRFRSQIQTFPNVTCDGCDTSLYVWPPQLLLDKNGIDNVTPESLALCARTMKDQICGKTAECKENKCYCPRGYRVLENTIRNIGENARILRCEETTVADLDDCALGTHKCSENTTCEKIPGGYICKCKSGYRKSTENDQRDCFDYCTPSPCVKGTCSMNKDKFNCHCEAGYIGSFCQEQDVNLAAAKNSTVVVGAVLGTILIVLALGILFFYLKKRKSSYSEDFMPAPRQDIASEMRERRPIRGVVNTSYE